MANDLVAEVRRLSEEIDYWDNIIAFLALIDDTFADYPRDKLIQAKRYLKPYVAKVEGSPEPLADIEQPAKSRMLRGDLDKALFELRELRSVMVRFVAGPLRNQTKFLSDPDWSEFKKEVEEVNSKGRAGRFSDRVVEDIYNSGRLARLINPEKLARVFGMSLESGTMGGAVTPGFGVAIITIAIIIGLAIHHFVGPSVAFFGR